MASGVARGAIFIRESMSVRWDTRRLLQFVNRQHPTVRCARKASRARAGNSRTRTGRPTLCDCVVVHASGVEKFNDFSPIPFPAAEVRKNERRQAKKDGILNRSGKEALGPLNPINTAEQAHRARTEPPERKQGGGGIRSATG